MDFLANFKAARRAGTPIIAVTTTNQHACRESIQASFNGDAPPILAFDMADGPTALTPAGAAALGTLGIDPDSATCTEFLRAARRLPARSIVFVMNAHRLLNTQAPGFLPVTQALLNLRDPFKSSTDDTGRPAPRTIVLLGPGFSFPEELASDVVLLDEPLPDELALAEIVRSVIGDEAPDALVAQAADKCRGLTAFLAEQNVAMSLRPEGLDLNDLADRQIAAIGAIPGITVRRSTTGFAAAGGQAGIKARLAARANGPMPFKLVVRLDEVDKQFGGQGGGFGDTSGTTVDQAGVILKELDDNGYTGFLSLGGPGTGKTLISRCIAGEFGILELTLDLPALKDKWVGASEARIRQAFKVIKSLAGNGGALFNGTCNRVDNLLPEIKRRFRLGVYVFDKPTAAERETIWTICLTQYGLPLDLERPDNTDWTGADIRNCCEEAYASRLSLIDAARFLVITGKSERAVFEKIRTDAVDRYLSADTGETYSLAHTITTTPKRRRVAVED